MSYVPTLEQAEEILGRYNKDEFHLKHGKIVSGVMGYFAKEYDPERVDYWKVVGLLHDLDFELYPEEHCIKSQEIMKELDLDEGIIRSTASHGYGLTVNIEPEHVMEKILFATDELTGLIGAVAIMRPSKSVSDLEVKSLKKKFKDKRFAAGCSRDVIRQGAEMLGWELDELFEKTILAMRSLMDEMEI
ncbi:MAG: hydrolase [Lachnospiraceae bacterium]|nr:hydrolase [Lachnospiraceae bacterium]